jgi:hypothetical protein
MKATEMIVKAQFNVDQYLPTVISPFFLTNAYYTYWLCNSADSSCVTTSAIKDDMKRAHKIAADNFYQCIDEYMIANNSTMDLVGCERYELIRKAIYSGVYLDLVNNYSYNQSLVSSMESLIGFNK